MTDRVRVWLVERTYSDRNLVTLVYATPDGQRALTRELSSSTLSRASVTAATDVDAERLEPVTDDSRRERYRAEAARVRENNDPDEEI